MLELKKLEQLEQLLSEKFSKPNFSILKDLKTQKIEYTNSHNQKSEYEIGTFENSLDFKQIYAFDDQTLNEILNCVKIFPSLSLVVESINELISSNHHYNSNKETDRNKHLFTALVIRKTNLDNPDLAEEVHRNKKIKTVIKDTIKKYLFSSKIRLFEFSRMKMAS